ncbi:hypothetical protein Golomagni_06630 [Golovinomyces magnicellulatus]|nr:hypothetical protein Golomagni_06630 [Golovinomyces magnicellulatus]
MPKTRTSKSSGDSDTAPASKAATTKYTLSTRSGHSQKLFILPSKATAESRIVTLPHPRTTKPSRYLICPETGIYELTKIAAPKTTPRSWLVEKPAKDDTSTPASANVVPSGDIFVATALDPLFLILPSLAPKQASKDDGEQKGLFLASDDHFDNLPQEASHLSDILRSPKTRKLFEKRMAAACDTVEAGDESMFRVNQAKLASIIWNKAKRLSNAGLPASIEEKFVQKALEAPMVLTKRVVKTEVSAVESTDSAVSTPKTENTDSQSSVAASEGAASTVSQVSTAATSVTGDESNGESPSTALQASPEILQLQRLRVAFEFICSSYLPAALAQQLKTETAKDSTLAADFSSLDEYVVKLNQARSDALAARSVGDFSRKRARDEEEDEARADKKRKLEEEKKRKASESRGVRDLKKVNTVGMKKMSDFFKKK